MVYVVNSNVVPVIDTSASMSSYGYVSSTVRDSQAFISLAQNGDGIGVVNYDTQGNLTYSDNGKLKIVSSPSDIQAAEDAIKALSFQGNCTNIGDGIVKAKTLLDPASNPRGIVLLTDGYQNCGTDPLASGILPTDYPIYACAMGANSNQALLHQIAALTGGEYYYIPYPADMMQILNNIRALPDFINSVLNEQINAPAQNPLLVGARISSGITTSKFSVVWEDSSWVYTSAAQPQGKQISITLVDPQGQTHNNPTINGDGYVIFEQQNPDPGFWNVQLIFGTNASQFQATVGILEYPENPQKAVVMAVESPTTIKAGQPLEFRVRVTDQNQIVPFHLLSTIAEGTQPQIGLANAIKLYQENLSTVQPQSRHIEDGIPENLARLMALREAWMPHRDILAPHKSHIYLQQEVEENLLVGEITNTAEAGSYNIYVSTAGYSPVTGTPFQRSQLVSVLVE